MPGYTIKVKSDAILDRQGLERLEDVVYDVLTKEYGGSTDLDNDWVGITDVEATFD